MGQGGQGQWGRGQLIPQRSISQFENAASCGVFFWRGCAELLT